MSTNNKKQDTLPLMESVEEQADLLYGLAIAEYCTESERDGFMYSIDNGCSLDKSNGYCAGFVNGFQKGYLHQQHHIVDIETKQDNVPQVKSVVEYSKTAENAAGLLADIDIFRVLRLPNEAINRIDLFVLSHTAPFQSRIEELEASNAKYREALEWIAKEWYQGSNDKSPRTDIPLLNKIEQALNSKEVSDE